MKFIKWLGVKVPEWVEQRIFSEDATPAKTPLNKSPVERSVDILCDMCEDILEQTKDSGVPLGVSVESVPSSKTKSKPRMSCLDDVSTSRWTFSRDRGE